MGMKGVITAILVAVALARPVAADAAPILPPEALCAAETSRMERSYGIPSQLLHSISIVESGRYDKDKGATLAWPWTVTAEGKGRYLPTKAEAIAEVKRLRARGVKNIDVGCMQVNMMYHPDAFDSLEEAFSPDANVAYAARFLKGLFDATNHWVTAASYYHSQTPSLAAAYRERLMKVWNGVGTQVASLPAFQSVKPGPAGRPVPSASPRVDEMRKAWRDQQDASRDEARAIADAYRKARLGEYKLRRAAWTKAGYR